MEKLQKLALNYRVLKIHTKYEINKIVAIKLLEIKIVTI